MTSAGEPPILDRATGTQIPRESSRIFLMINSFETGGSERQFAALAKSLDPGRFPLSLGCIQTKGPLRELFGDVPRFHLGGSVYGWKSWQSRRQLARHLREKKIQVAHSFDFYTNLTLAPAARWARVPVIIASQRQMGDLLSPAQARVQRLVFGMCTAVVCNSRAAANKLARDGVSATKICVIGNALAPESFADTPPLFARRAGVPRVGMIARMNAHYKNHLGFLRAAAVLLGSFPQMEFVLVGDGPLRPELERECAHLGISAQVKFLGERRDISAVLASLDGVVVPSDSESLSNVILESMAAGLPVVATDVGGNPELVTKDRGILVPPRDVDALAAAVARLLQSVELRAELGENARRFVRENFSTQSVTAQYQDLYAQLLATKFQHATAKSSCCKVRVAIVAPTLRYVGGQAVQADLLLKNWKDDPGVLATFVPIDPEFPAGLGWVASIPGLRTLIRIPFYLAGLWRGLRGADVAHIFSASYSSFLLAPMPAWVVAKILGRNGNGPRTLINYRSGEARDHLRRSRIARAVLRRTDARVAPSGYLVDVFGEFRLSFGVVPNIVDLSQFRFRERKPLRPHLVCTRGFHTYYCVDVVVQAFARVQQEFPAAVLDLVGGGPLEAQIRELVSSLGLKNVNFCGVALRHEIGKYYDRADIFINASRLDNMPVSVLEAFASGTPVITTAPEGMRYLVEDGRTGLLSPVGDAKALAANVMRVLEDSQLAERLISNGVAESERYHWNAVREQWLRIYYALAGRQSAAGANLPVKV
jgi:glycosyltransferase involved in cell wall biosynthesis